jgi:sigma-B regulation protein RsbU (phosphoserine phosphatase)
MTIRSKLLILLLLIAVVPLGAVGFFDLLTARQLGQRLADDRRRILTQLAFEQMQQVVESYGRVLRRDQRILEHAVTLQAREAEQRLAQTEPSSRRIYFASDWEGDLDDAPPGTEPSPRHTRPNAAAQREPIPVSYQEQTVFVVRGVEVADVEKDLRRLSTMPEAYRFVNRLRPEQMYWQYTSLEVGFHSAFPGHGGYPDDYDPRRRPWYTRAKQAGEPTWVLLPEVSTRTVSLTVATPVHRRDGSFAGVTAIDVPLTSLFSSLNLPRRWADQAEAMLIGPGDQIGLSAAEAVILARQRYEPGDDDLDWRQPVEPEMLRADEPARLRALLADAEAGKAGVARIHVDGEPFLIAYGSGGVFPVVKVPELVLLADVEQARKRVLSETRRRQIVGLVTLVVLVLGVVWIAFAASRRVTRPARSLAEAAHRLAEGDYDAQVHVRGKDELAQLGEVFNQVGPQLRERERIKHSLAVAMDVQRNLLPSATPTLQGLDVAGHSTYCDETGGDYYDYLDIVGLDQRSVAVVVGDVMGHGVAAAMLMATARGILRSRCTTPGSLADLLNHLNALLVEDTGGTRFMTMMLMVIHAQDKGLRFASAGHDPPFVYDPASDTFHELESSGLPLGIMAEERYDEDSFSDLSPGTVLLTATDGVWEMKGEDGGMFGKQRVMDLLRAHHALSARQIEQKLLDALQAHRGHGAPDDDVTFVVVKLE